MSQLLNTSASCSDLTVKGVVRHFERRGRRLVQHLEAGERAAETCVTADDTGDALGDWWRAYLAGSEPIGPVTHDLTVVELFSGSGGMALGFRQAALELGASVRVAAAVDQDADALAVYRNNHGPNSTVAESVSLLVDYHVRRSREQAEFHYPPELLRPEWQALAGKVDVLLAGPPCQGHSNLNNRSRRTDRRNDLYLAVPAIAVALGVRALVIENVPAVVHDRTGVVSAATALLRRAGYAVETGTIRAPRIGWAQNRSRYFLVATACEGSRPLAPAVVESSLTDEPRSVAWAFSGLDSVDLPDYLTELPELSADNRRRIDWLFDNNQHELGLGERPECHQAGTTYNSVYGRMFALRPAPTITTGFLTPGRGRFIHPTERRVINVAEAARLQGFPVTYDFSVDGDPPSKAKLTKWTGDAVPMPLAHAAALCVLPAVLGTPRAGE